RRVPAPARTPAARQGLPADPPDDVRGRPRRALHAGVVRDADPADTRARQLRPALAQPPARAQANRVRALPALGPTPEARRRPASAGAPRSGALQPRRALRWPLARLHGAAPAHGLRRLARGAAAGAAATAQPRRLRAGEALADSVLAAPTPDPGPARRAPGA